MRIDSASVPEDVDADSFLSVSTEHLPISPRELSPCAIQRSCAHAVDGTFRGRPWDLGNRGDVWRP